MLNNKDNNNIKTMKPDLRFIRKLKKSTTYIYYTNDLKYKFKINPISFKVNRSMN